ncbi:MAG: flagellar filament capping protein FliD [Candidatus Competibacteraceae bacterium]
MTGITASGLGSGMDISSLVSQLVAAERNPAVKRLDSRETTLKAQVSAIGSFKSVLSNFQSALASLKETDTFQSMKATVADSSLFTATTDNGAQAGSYNIKVEKLAQAQRLATATGRTFAGTSDVVGTGVLTIQFGTSANGTFTANPEQSTQSITIDATNNTLAGVRDAINKADIGVIASIVNDGSGYRLVLGAENSGAANSLKITVSDGDGTNSDLAGLSLLAYDPTGTAGKNMVETVAAANAQIVVDGLTVTSASNTLKEVVPGVTLSLKATGTTATNLTVEQDSSEVTKALETFVKSYNDLMNTTKSLTAYNTETKVAGTFGGGLQCSFHDQSDP